MRKSAIILVSMIIAAAAGAQGVYGPLLPYQGLSNAVWQSTDLSVTGRVVAGGSYSNAWRWYKITGTNRAGRLPWSQIMSNQVTGLTNSFSLSWGAAGGAEAYILEASSNGVDWTWRAFGPRITSYLDVASTNWSTNDLPELPEIENRTSVGGYLPLSGGIVSNLTVRHSDGGGGTYDVSIEPGDSWWTLSDNSGNHWRFEKQGTTYAASRNDIDGMIRTGDSPVFGMDLTLTSGDESPIPWLLSVYAGGPLVFHNTIGPAFSQWRFRTASDEPMAPETVYVASTWDIAAAVSNERVSRISAMQTWTNAPLRDVVTGSNYVIVVSNGVVWAFETGE